MKKIIMRLALSLLVLIGLVSTLPAEELYVGKIHFLDVDTTLDDYFNIKYETEYNQMYIQKGNWSGTSWIILNNDQIETLRSTVSKALDWCKIAYDNNSEIKKELPNSNLESSVVWEFGDETHRNSDYNKLQLQFFFVSAKTEYDEIFPSVLIFSSKVKSSKNQYVTYNFPRAVLLEEDLKTFKEVISQDSINSVVEKHKESRKAEDLFN